MFDLAYIQEWFLTGLLILAGIGVVVNFVRQKIGTAFAILIVCAVIFSMMGGI